MTYKRFLISLMLLSVLGLLTDCKRTLKDEDIFGPEYRPAPADFAITSPLASNVVTLNFINGLPKYFTASFSHTVTWTLTIVGQTSGAQKILTGLSSSLDASNTSWDGGSSNMIFFHRGENVTATLTFMGSDLTSSTTMNILIPKYYDTTIDGVKYTVIEDFEATNSLSATDYNIGSAFRDMGDDPVVNIASSDLKIQASRAYHFSGTDKNSNGWIAGVTTDSLNQDSAFRASTVQPEDFYINLYVYGTGKEFSSLQVKAYEIDNWSQATFAGKYNQTINDGWVYDIVIDWTGWKLVSLRYSNFKRAADPLLGGNGNNIRQPQNITGFALGLNSYPTSGKEVETYVDMIVVTEGGPFKP